MPQLKCFVEDICGGNIRGSSVMVEEIITLAKKRKNKMLVFKVDFNKKFEKISWPMFEQYDDTYVDL